MLRQSLVSLVVAASFALAGCGTGTMGTLSTVAIPQAAAPAQSAGIVTTVTKGAAERQHHQTPLAPVAPVKPQTPAVPLSTLVVNGHIALTDEILAEDAESEGYSVASDSKLESKFSKSGVIRRTAAGFSLEASNGLLKLFKKEKDTFALTGAPEVITLLAARENKKALIKGTVDADDVVTVLSVKNVADLGFLTNWFSKGKIVGLAVDRASGLPIAGAAVSAKSAEGFVFKTASESDGTFTLKNLTPGKYAVTIVHEGHVTLDAQELEVLKRKAADVTAKLAPEAGE